MHMNLQYKPTKPTVTVPQSIISFQLLQHEYNQSGFFNHLPAIRFCVQIEFYFESEHNNITVGCLKKPENYHDMQYFIVKILVIF